MAEEVRADETQEVTPATEVDEQKGHQQEADGDSAGDLPGWAKSQLEKARREAASYRTQLREAQEKLGKAKSEDEFNAVVTELNQKLAERDRELVLERYGITEDEASLIVGDGVDDWEAKAKLVQSLKAVKEPEKAEPPATKRPPQGGRESSRDNGGTVDPVELARRARARR